MVVKMFGTFPLQHIPPPFVSQPIRPPSLLTRLARIWHRGEMGSAPKTPRRGGQLIYITEGNRPGAIPRAFFCSHRRYPTPVFLPCHYPVHKQELFNQAFPIATVYSARSLPGPVASLIREQFDETLLSPHLPPPSLRTGTIPGGHICSRHKYQRLNEQVECCVRTSSCSQAPLAASLPPLEHFLFVTGQTTRPTGATIPLQKTNPSNHFSLEIFLPPPPNQNSLPPSLPSLG